MTTFPNWSDNPLPPVVILAGGKSERMKTAKGLLPFRGKSWLEYQLDCYQNAGGKEAAVVLGYKADEYLTALSFLKLNETTDYNGLTLTALLNPLPQFGPFSTIQTGLSFFLKKGYEVIAFSALDKPAPAPEVWHELTNVLKMQKSEMVFPVRGGQDGHPVLLSRSLAEKIVSLSPENKRMDYLRTTLPPRSCVTVEQTDKNVGQNLNTPQDWQRFLESNTL